MRQSTLLQRLKELEPATLEKELFARVLCGEVRVDGATVRAPAERVPAGAVIELLRRRRFVSRGGEKLDGVLGRWNLDVAGLSLLDAGASTGGFTDCLLQRGACGVLAVEKGFNQLDYRLRQDPRVVLLEKTNIMDLTGQMLPLPVEAAVADLSLRSLRSAAGHILSLIPGGWLIALAKPQYERGAGAARSHAGVIRSQDEALEILRRLLQGLDREGLSVVRAAPSPLQGARGNREFFFHIVRRPAAAGPQGLEQPQTPPTLEELVAEAFPG